MESDKYNVENLYLGIVESVNRNKITNEIHILSDSAYKGEKYDLNLCKYIDEYSLEDVYIEKSLVPITQLLTPKINWGNVSREDALKMGYFMSDKYLKFLRIKRVTLTRSK